MSLLSLDEVTKFYPAQPLPAVDHLSLELERGEILALLGPSGCGKTTTLRLIAGFERLDAGVVRIGGKLMADERLCVPPEQRGVGVVFQEYTLFPHLTVDENVMFGLRHLSAPPEALWPRCPCRPPARRDGATPPHTRPRPAPRRAPAR